MLTTIAFCPPRCVLNLPQGGHCSRQNHPLLSCGVNRASMKASLHYTGFPYTMCRWHVQMGSRFDPNKNSINLKTHKLSLAFGVVEQKLFTGVFTWRDKLPRFISVRRSNNGEERAYHSGL